MIEITFPDGKKKKYSEGTTALDIAKSISEGLAREVVAAKFNDKLIDAFIPLNESGRLKLLKFEDPEGLEVFRHSSTHLMAQAVKRLFPYAKLTIGPVIEEGFYYDIDHEPFSPEDIKKIEEEMKKIVHENYKCERHVLSKNEALKLFKDNEYKIELINEMCNEICEAENPSSKKTKLVKAKYEKKKGKNTIEKAEEKIESAKIQKTEKRTEQITAYKQGEFIDLCKGPHIPRTGMIKAFKITKIAGAYWRGDSNNKQLQRLYGISFPEKKQLDEYLYKLEEAKARDHRAIGKKMDLFSFNEISPGAPFFHPNGAIIFNELMQFVREEYKKRGYKEVITPLLYGKSLWHQSGHWDHYKENMFLLTVDGKEASIKPMNCPSHCLIYKASSKSYRDLPLRLADFAPLHRNELKGVLGGLTRVRKFQQDDSHTFCTLDQLEDEIIGLLDYADYIYKNIFDFNYSLELSTRPEKSLGTEEQWNKAESALKNALNKKKLAFSIKEGEGAFYGPKIDMHIKDALDRSWQCATIQVDFNLPERFDLEYDDKDGKKRRPVMVHKAILGSIERFMGVLIEHYAGKFPVWLCPEQVRLLPIADRHNEYCNKLLERMKSFGIRATCDYATETMNKKVRDAQMQYVPLMLTIGDKEIEKDTIAVRTLDGKVKFGIKTEEFIQNVVKNIKERKVKFDV